MADFQYDEQQGLDFQKDVQSAYKLADKELDLSNVVWSNRMTWDARDIGYPSSRRKHLYGPGELYDQLHLPVPVPPVNPNHWQGAFCIPNTLPGIPYGDGTRIWTPAFGCYSQVWQDRIITEFKHRGYTHFEYLISGFPYSNHYPYLPADTTRIVFDLYKLKQAGLATIVAFDDSRGEDCSYLTDVAAHTQDLVDWVMGIYEVNGVLKDPNKVLDVLKQSHALWPKARIAVHFTPLDEGNESYGLVDFQRAKDEAGLQALLFQSANWNHPDEIISRIRDFQLRLQVGYHSWAHPFDIVAFELSTSRTYRDWTEGQGVSLSDYVMQQTSLPFTQEGFTTIPLTGFCDGGTVRS